jgi:diguanylate cyclase (GGDEF)-like protein
VLYLQRASNGDAATGAGKILEGETRTARDDWGQLGCTVAERLALSLSNILLRETLRQQSVRDPLTGAYNRRYMEETLRRELLRAVRHKHPVGLIMLDIDQFKKINERHGHEVGDQLLRELGRYLMSSVRGEDVVCRFGEETFCVVMPGAALDDTIRRAEELRIGSSAITLSELMRSEEGEPASPERTAPAAVSSLPSKGVLARYSAESAGFPVDRSRRAVVEPIMISLGVAAHPHNGSSVENLLKSADLALQQAKSQGFNRVVAADSKGSGVTQAGKK